MEGPSLIPGDQDRRGYEHQYYCGRYPRLGKVASYCPHLHGVSVEGLPVTEFIPQLAKVPYFSQAIRVCWDRCRSQRQSSGDVQTLVVEHWPMPVIICDVAKFVGFMQLYSHFIPNFEIHITALREILCEEYMMTLRKL